MRVFVVKKTSIPSQIINLLVGDALYICTRVGCKVLECLVNYVVCKMCSSLTFLYFPHINVGAPSFFPVHIHVYLREFYIRVTTLIEYVDRELRANAFRQGQIDALLCSNDKSRVNQVYVLQNISEHIKNMVLVKYF